MNEPSITKPEADGGVALPQPCSAVPPATPDEIAMHRRVMMATGDVTGKPPREYTDEELASSLVEIIPDTGGTMLGFMRVSKRLIELLPPNARCAATAPEAERDLG